MNILALETSSLVASAAVLIGERLLAEQTAPGRSAKTLLPLVSSLLDAAGLRPRDIELVAVSTGPGSFTGLRVGVTAAKAFAYAARAKVRAVATPGVLAEQAPREAISISAVIDAHRGELFAADFFRDGGLLRPAGETRVVSIDDWLAKLDSAALVTGPGLSHCVGRLPPGQPIAPPESRLPRAATVGRLAHRDLAEEGAHDLWTLAPCYHRPSAAEEKAKTHVPV